MSDFVTFRIIPDIRTIQDKINADIARMAAVMQPARDPSLPFWWDRIDPKGTE